MNNNYRKIDIFIIVLCAFTVAWTICWSIGWSMYINNNIKENEIEINNNTILNRHSRSVKNITKHKKNKNIQPEKSIGHFILDNNNNEYKSAPFITFDSTLNISKYYPWKLVNWINNKIFNKFFYIHDNGIVTVQKAGLYLIYVQMTYHDLAGKWSFGVNIGGVEKFKCITTEYLTEKYHHDPINHSVFHQCYTASVVYIRRNENIIIKCMYGSRIILARPEFTFWGIIKLN